MHLDLLEKKSDLWDLEVDAWKNNKTVFLH